MKNVTITLDEKTANWARQCAAGRDMSLSRFVGELLEANMRESRRYEEAMRRYLSREPAALKRSDRAYPTRGELHER